MADTPLDNRRGWAVTIGAAAANFIGFGTLFSFGIFFNPLAEEFGTTTGRVAALFSISVCFYYLAGVLGGRFGDRRGIRLVVSLAAVILPVGLFLTSRAGGLGQLYLTYAPLVGLGVGFCYSPMLGAVGRWFDEQRQLATGVVLAGVGAGTLAMPMILQRLLARYEWRTTLVILAVAAFVVIGSAALVSGDPPRSTTGDAVSVRTLAGSRRFRRLYLAVLAIGPGFYAPLAFFNNYALDQGIDARRAAVLVGVVGGSSVVVRLLLGSLGDRFDALAQYRFSYGLMTAALVVWLLAGGSYLVLIVAAIIHGVGWAAWVMATPALLASWFGVRDLGGVIGIFYTGLGFGALGGPAVTGIIIDRWGWRPAIILAIATTVLATAIAGLSMEEPSDRNSASLLTE